MSAQYNFEKKVSEYDEKVLEINRISRTVKGGRRIRFRALVIMGNHKGKVGFGVAKANEVVSAIAKAKKQAMKNMVEIIIKNDTIPYQISAKFGGAEVMLKPAPAGTSLIAGGSVRNLLDIAGIKNIVSKSLGSNNKINVITATYKAVTSIKVMPTRIEKIEKTSTKGGSASGGEKKIETDKEKINKKETEKSSEAKSSSVKVKESK